MKGGKELGDSVELNKAISEFAGQRNVEIKNSNGETIGYSYENSSGNRITTDTLPTSIEWTDPVTITDPTETDPTIEPGDGIVPGVEGVG